MSYKTYKMHLKVLGDNVPIFKEGWSEGVIAIQEVDIEMTKIRDSVHLAVGLNKLADEFRDAMVAVVVEEK